jgi:integrase/recombinase XerD
MQLGIDARASIARATHAGPQGNPGRSLRRGHSEQDARRGAGVLRAAWELGHIDTDSYQRAVPVRPVRGEAIPHGRSVSKGELRALFTACFRGRSMIGARAAALLSVLYGSGLRRAEASALDVGNYNPEVGSLTVRAGKGDKQRV